MMLPKYSYPKSTRGLEHKLPLRDAIIAHAILPKALGGSSTNSLRETLSSLTRSYLKHSGARAQTPPRETLSSLTRSYLKHSRDRAQTPPPRDSTVAHTIL